LPPHPEARLPARRPTPAAESSWLGRTLGAPFRAIEREVRARLEEAPLQINEYGFDAYGVHRDAATRVYVLATLFYRYWFRVETHGIDRVPAGRVLLVANHAGQFGYDGAMLATAMLLEADPPRIVRGMAEYFFRRTPWLGELVTQIGSVVGTPENCTALLAADSCLMAFPEGARGASKPFRKRYQLQPFGHGFMRLALASDAPIVPVGIIGPEEQQPGFADWTWLGHRLGLPSFPITVSMPWFGPLGAPFALPVKYHLVAQVKQAVADLIARGLSTRRGIFR